MKKFIYASFLIASLAALSAPSVFAQSAPVLTPPKDRITDEAQQADLAVYEKTQERIKAINETGVPLRSYNLAKAQCWLDVSYHEYTRNDRSAFVDESLAQSQKIIAALERKETTLVTETPLVNGAARLRPDLWARADALHSNAGFACAAQRVACGEVELVHAGNEYNQQQFKHAAPYVQIAEEQLADAESVAKTCLPAPAPVAAVVPPPAPVPEAVQLRARVLFDFDKSGAANIRASSLASVDDLVSQIRSREIDVQRVDVVGYADRLNSTGNAAYNVELSRKRAETVKGLLVSRGISASVISTDGRGASQQVDDCKAQFNDTDALKECLLPNRRVEIQLSGTNRKK